MSARLLVAELNVWERDNCEGKNVEKVLTSFLILSMTCSMTSLPTV